MNDSSHRRFRGFALGMTVALLGMGALGAGAAVAVSRFQTDPTKIAPGVRIREVSVGGLSREAAQEQVRQWARTQLGLPITVTAPVSEKKWTFTLAEAGGRFDIEAAVDAAWQIGKDDNLFERLYLGNRERNVVITPEFKLDVARLDARLAKIGKEIQQPSRNAKAKIDAKGNLILVAKEQKGITLDEKATHDALLKDGIPALASGTTATLVVKEDVPKITSSDLGKMGELLGAFATDYSSSPSNRKFNVGLAASKIDGTLLAPGEIFSYNGCVGPREASLGWKMAHQYQDGLVVDGIGGGVCQVSTTLYNAVLQADLKVRSRSNHSMPVAYVRLGRDATVSYGNTDFRFENSTAGPILIGARADGEKLTFRIFGTQKTERKVLDIYTTPRKYTSDGWYSVTSYRKVQLPDGNTVTELIAGSSYRPPKAVPAKVKPKAKPKPKAVPAKLKPTPAPVIPPSAGTPTTTEKGNGNG